MYTISRYLTATIGGFLPVQIAISIINVHFSVIVDGCDDHVGQNTVTAGHSTGQNVPFIADSSRQHWPSVQRTELVYYINLNKKFFPLTVLACECINITVETVVCDSSLEALTRSCVVSIAHIEDVHCHRCGGIDVDGLSIL